jgi:phage N-6-adenine-methyltransferase
MKGADSMTQLDKIQRREISQFDPAKTKDKLTKIDALVDYAKKIQDWPLLEEAVDAKIEEQIEFCRWWEREVTPFHAEGAHLVTDRKLDKEEVQEWKVRVHRWKKYLNSLKAYRGRLLGAEYRAALLHDKKFYGEHENENEELYTPAIYIEAARKVLGDFDLDPASCAKAQETVKAKAFYGIKDSSLNRDWLGRVWLNPPYSQPNINDFTEKLISELSLAHVSAAILLTNNHTDTGWFHHCESIAAAICFTRGRIKFIDAVRGEVMPTAGQAFFY